jgi:hypothetical protein
VERLNRHSDAIRSVSEVQMRHAGALRQVAVILKRIAAPAEAPPSHVNTQR